MVLLSVSCRSCFFLCYQLLQTSQMSVVAYASDRFLLATAASRSLGSPGMMASLDHSMWFHADCRADEWLLFDMRCSRTSNARGLVHGEVYRSDGAHVISIAQEGLIRYAIDKESSERHSDEASLHAKL